MSINVLILVEHHSPPFLGRGRGWGEEPIKNCKVICHDVPGFYKRILFVKSIDMKLLSSVLLLLVFPLLLFSQPKELKGILLDQATHAPIPNAHLKIRSSGQGTVTGPDGTFSLTIRSLPALVDFTCIGYEGFSLEISAIPVERRTFYLKPKTYMLDPVTVSDKPAVILYKDEDYSVLDFDFLGSNLILIVFRYQLKRAEVILMTTSGDTLAVAPVPSSPALGLYRDVISNIHFITKKDEAFQAVYDPVQNRLVFPYKTTYDTIKKFLGGYRFLLGHRLW